MSEIVCYPNTILREKSHRVESIDESIREKLSMMARLMYKYDGVGLAAPQVGLNLRLVVMDAGKGLLKLINPVLLEVKGEKETMEEGCLSLPNIYLPIERRIGVAFVEAEDLSGKKKIWKLEGFASRVIQHELDHLDGILIIDRAKEIPEETRARLREMEGKYGGMS